MVSKILINTKNTRMKLLFFVLINKTKRKIRKKKKKKNLEKEKEKKDEYKV